MSEVGDRLDKQAAEEKLLDSLLLDLTKSGKLEWQRCRFGIYDYVTRVGQYTIKMLKNCHTLYISTKDAEKDLHASGKAVWYFLIKKTERPDRQGLIQELQKRENV